MSELAAKLRGGRAVAASGRLSLDREKAREKLRLFRLPDPHFYVLQFVRAASVLGAAKIEFTFDADEMLCTFDGTLPPELLRDIWSVAFEERTGPVERAAHHLALGLGSAQALKPAAVVVESGGVRLMLSADEEVITEVVESSTTHIYLKEKFRFGHLVEFFTTLGGTFPEVIGLRKHCAFASLEVFVNGKSIQRDIVVEGEFGQKFQRDDVRGSVAVDSIATDSWFVLMRDDVMLQKRRASPHGIAAMIAVDCDSLQTDLSGLSLIDDGAVGILLHGAVYGVYHSALLRWASSDSASDEDVMGLAADVFDYVGLLNGAKRPLAPETRELFDWLLDQPLFTRATGKKARASISIRRACNLDSLHVAQQLFPGLKSDQPALLIEDLYGMGRHRFRHKKRPELGVVDHAVQTMLRGRMIKALRRSGEFTVRDVTMTLVARQNARRNREIWRAQPLRDFPTWPFQKAASVGHSLGNVFLPVQEPGGALDEAEFGCAIYIKSRLIRQIETSGPLGVGIDGELAPTPAFDNVVREPDFDRLAVALCVNSFELYQDYARALTEHGKQAPERPRLLDEFLARLFRGTYCHWFLQKFGYAKERLDGLVAEAPELEDLRWFAEPRPPAEVLDRLGPLKDVPSFDMAVGRALSLHELCAREQVSILRPVGRWREFLADKALSESFLRGITVVDGLQGMILRCLRPAIEEASTAWHRRVAYQVFLDTKVYEDDRPSEAIATSQPVTVDGAKIEVHMLPLQRSLWSKGSGVCDTVFVWNRRQLARRPLDVQRGNFRAIVTSDELEPAPNYRDLVDGPRLTTIIGKVQHEATELLFRWWRDLCRAGKVPGKSASSLFLELSISAATDHPDHEVIPTLIWDGSHWQAKLMSSEQLTVEVASDGLVLAYTLSERASREVLARNESPVVLLGRTTAPNTLRRLIHGVKLVDATPGSPTGLQAHTHFHEKPRVEMKVAGKGIKWRGVIDGFSCATAMFSDPTYGAGRQKNKVTALYSGRALESIDVELPFGQFRSLIEATSEGVFRPDPGYKFVAAGRAELLSVALECAAATIREACRLFSLDPYTPVLSSVRDDLIRYIAVCRELDPPPPFDLLELLESTPLFETTTGVWLSLGELPSISQDGMLGYDADWIHPQVLRLSHGDVAPVARALAGKLELVEAGDLGFVVSPVPKPPTERTLDPILTSVTEMLLSARGDRLDLLDDRLAGTLRWSKVSARQLCSVSPAGIEIDGGHPLVQEVRAAGDKGARAFLASAVYSAVNLYYSEITDPDELELQRRLLRLMRE